MTIREKLNRRIVRTYVVMAACFVLFIVASGFGATDAPWLVALVSGSFAGFLACVLFLHVATRCPGCRERIASLVYLPRGGYFRLSGALRFCLFCGISTDAEVGGAVTDTAGTTHREVP